MKFFRSFFFRKYLKTMFLAIISLLLIIVIGFSVLINYSSGRFIKAGIENANRDVLNQISNNVSNVNNLVRDLCATAFYNTNVVNVMETYFDGSDDSNFDLIIEFGRLEKALITSNSYIQSITIHNYKTDKYYNNKVEGINEGDLLLKETLQKFKSIPVRKPFLRKIQTQGTSPSNPEWVMTYAMYDSYDESGKPKGAIFINVKPQWILNDIENLNTINTNNNQIYLYNDGKLFSGKDFNTSSAEKNMAEVLNNKILPQIKQDTNYGFVNIYGFEIINVDSEKSYVSYLSMKGIGWTLIRVQSFSEVFRSVNAMQTVLIIITLIFVGLSVLSSYFASKRIYRPMNLLLDRISDSYTGSDNKGKRKTLDEIRLIEDIYRKSVDTININAENKLTMHNTVKSFYFLKLLYESGSLASEDISKAIQDKYLSIKNEGKYVVCLIRTLNQGIMDNVLQMAFAAANIANELLIEKYANDYETLKNGDAVLIVNFDGDEEKLYSHISDALKVAQGYVREYYDTSFAAVVSPVFYKLEDTSNNLQLAYKEIDYTYILGLDSIIRPEDIKVNQKNTCWDYSFDLEYQLAQNIKSGDTEQIKETVKNILSGFAKQNYNNIQLSAMHLATTVRNELEEQKGKALLEEHSEFDIQYRQLLELKTIDEYSERLMEFIIGNIKEKAVEEANKTKNNITVDTIKKIIELKYADRSLCTAQIAETIRMNSSYVSRIFKENVGKSISDYINYIRITRAAEMLASKKISISEVMETVGIDSKTHFYRHFKNIFGETPKEYILKRNTI